MEEKEEMKRKEVELTEKEIQEGMKLTGKSRGWVVRTLTRGREKKVKE